MYYYIKGKITQKKMPILIIETSGIGYQILSSMHTFNQLGDEGSEIFLYLHFIPREDSFNLYGFFDIEEKELFLKLTSVSGIGPKSAIAMLSNTSPKEMIKQIVKEDKQLLQKAPGVGKKTAERIIVELKDKFKDIELAQEEVVSQKVGAKIAQEAIEALITLGYNKINAEKTISNILKKSPEIESVEVLIKQSLKNMM